MSPLRALVALLPLAGCIVYDDSGPAPAPVNSAPFVEDAVAGCYWEPAYRDHIWYFEAVVSDPDGPLDVVAVYGDVYDRQGVLIDSFDVLPTSDPYVWFSDWLGSSTWVDCAYPYYTVDIVAYDSFDAWDVLTIVPFLEP